MKLRVLITGIDGSGKTTALDGLIDALAKDRTVLRIGTYREPTLFSPDGTRPATRLAYGERVEAISRSARKFHLYSVYLVLNFLFKYAVARYLEIFRRADVVLYEKDSLLHPTVYMSFHLPITRSLSSAWRYRLVSPFFGPKRNVLAFYLDLDPRIASERIHARGEEVMPHENPRDLAELREEFDRVLQAAESGGVQVERLDTTHTPPEQIVAEMESRVRARLGAS